ALEPRAFVEMTRDARDLDLVHREDHAGRAAASSELEAGIRDCFEGKAETALLGGDERAERPLLAERVDRLAREARVCVDVGGMLGRDVLRDPGNGIDERAVGTHERDAHAATPSCSSSIASRIEATLSNTLRLSIASGNSRSNSFSSASIT